MKSVGMSTSNATPSQKREKRVAVMKEKARTPRKKVRKRKRGVVQRASWRSRKVCEFVSEALCVMPREIGSRYAYEEERLVLCECGRVVVVLLPR